MRIELNFEQEYLEMYKRSLFVLSSNNNYEQFVINYDEASNSVFKSLGLASLAAGLKEETYLIAKKVIRFLSF